MQQWFAVKTQARREVQVSQVFADRGVEVFLPLIPARRRRGLQVLEPLFPGYLFARLDLATNAWLAARSAPGVSYFLGDGSDPCALPADLIETIRAQVEMRQRHKARPPFDRGERVRIESGPMQGLEAIFEDALSASGRVRVLLAVVNRLVPVTLHITLLRKTG